MKHPVAQCGGTIIMFSKPQTGDNVMYEWNKQEIRIKAFALKKRY